MKVYKIAKGRTTYFKVGVRNKRCRGHNLYADVNEEEGKRLIEEAMGQGITFIDTADSYGFGRSEELVGKY